MTDRPRPPRPATRSELPDLDPARDDFGMSVDIDLPSFSAALHRWIAGPGAAILCRDILRSYHRLQTLLKGQMAGEPVHPESLAAARAEFRVAVAYTLRRKLETSGDLADLQRALCGERRSGQQQQTK